MQGPQTIRDLSSYLGADGFETFQNVVYDAQEVIKEIGRNVTGLLPADILNGDNKRIIRASSSLSVQDVKIKLADGNRLVWKKADLEKSIQPLDCSTRRFHMLVSAAARMPRIEQDRGPSNKAVTSLVRVRRAATRICEAFVRS